MLYDGLPSIRAKLIRCFQILVLKHALPSYDNLVRFTLSTENYAFIMNPSKINHDSGKTVTVIRSDTRHYTGFFGSVSALAKEVYQYRHQVWSVYKQNFRNSYFGTGLGMVWNFILPLVPLTVYVFLSQIKVFPSFEGVSRATYVAFGVTIWFVLTSFVQSPMSTVASRSKEAMKTAIPLSSSIVSSFANIVFDTSVRIIFIIFMMVFMQTLPSAMAPLVFVLFLAAFFLFFGAGLILSVLNAIYKDFARVTDIVLRYGLFLSGVIFPIGRSDLAVLLRNVNPFAVYVNASREIVFDGHIVDWLPLLIWSGLGLIVFLIGCRLFYVMEFKLREIS